MSGMEVEEHFYHDDPSKGPVDGRTKLKDVNYFFLGNGFIQAAVQVCLSGEGAPLGLLVMDPERLGPKRSALTFDGKTGLKETAIRIREGDRSAMDEPARHSGRARSLGGRRVFHGRNLLLSRPKHASPGAGFEDR
ncbi:MAG: hypothetical protein ACYTG7_14010 [Planctomycetota bacterium]|jgi:hypothetical protein